MTSHPERPWKIAARICELKTLEQRREALALVDPMFREQVETHIKNEFEKRKYGNQNTRPARPRNGENAY
ncbi:hypothetical protein UFOVP412_51 [uncultured Caudovirales phage]|uniref:Uncharacterized protein n=1 Tax=uncultured Caudovirales phage TaxID=2100421 RepID=A0A6J5M2K1_9CAUD|nr:hypothetical protein UFOVP412_51 [uncultured Caudovirales phage]